MAERAAQSRSDEIDRWLVEDSKRLRRECKVLLLGSRGSGKSTLAKQMKVFHGSGFSNQELTEYRSAVYATVVELAQEMVRYMKEAGLECVESSNQALAEKVVQYRLDSVTPSKASFSPEIAEAIHQLSKDPVLPKIMEEHTGALDLAGSVAYFFPEVLRIGSSGYVPTETDVLRARRESESAIDMRFNMGQLSIHMFEVSAQRSNRMKWIHCLEGVCSIVFCASLSDYDKLEGIENRLSESLVLFESVVNSRWFLRTSIILFLNKIDVFKHKLPRVPLKRYFPEYTGGPDINKAAKYILWKFMQQNRARLRVYPHLTQATDTTKVRLLFAALKETIAKNGLKGCTIV